MAMPVQSTHYSDPKACYTVSSFSQSGGGIDGYFTNEFAAHRVARYLKAEGHFCVTVAAYDPAAETQPGMHNLVSQFLNM